MLFLIDAPVFCSFFNSVSDSASVSRLIFSMQVSDIAEYDKKITHNATLDADARRALYRGLRQQIARNFKKASELKGRRVCSYCHIGGSSDYDKEVAFVLITKDLAAFGAGQETSSSSSGDDGCLRKKQAQNAEKRHLKDTKSAKGASCSSSGREEKHIKTEAKEAEVADDKGDKTSKVGGTATTSVRGESKKKKVLLTDEKKKHHSKYKAEGTVHLHESERKQLKTGIHKTNKDADKIVTSVDEHHRILAKTKKKDQGKEAVHKSSRGEVKKSAVKTDHVKEKGSEVSNKKQKKNEINVRETEVSGGEKNLESVGNEQHNNNLPALVTEQSCIGEKVAVEKSDGIKTADKSSGFHTEPRDVALNTDRESVEETVSEGAQTDRVKEGCIAIGRVVEILQPAPVSGSVGAAFKAKNSTTPGVRMFGSLFLLDDNSVLASGQCLTDEDSQKNEFELFKQYIASRIDSTTILRRFPTASDAELLAPKDTVKPSVTRRLVDFFISEGKDNSRKGRLSGPGRSSSIGNGDKCKIDPNRLETFEMKDDERTPGSASSVNFIGPFDRDVIQHDEYIRQRIAHVVDSSSWSTPADGGDVICVTDVGCDVQLVRVADVIGATRLPRDVSCRALVGVDTRRESASSVLLLFSSSSLTV